MGAAGADLRYSRLQQTAAPSALAWRNRMKLSAEQIRQFDDLGCVYFLAEYARAHRVASE